MYFCQALTLNNCMKRKNITLLISVLALTLSHCTTELPQLPDENDSDFVEDHTFSTVVAISYDNNTVIVTPETDDITSSIVGGNITIDSRKKYVEYILTGTTDNGSFKLYSTNKCKVTLNNVHITSNNTPAINIQTGKTIFIDVPAGTDNSLSDKNAYAVVGIEDAKGTLFSEGQLIFSGTGSVNVASKQGHGIISDDYIHIRSGEVRVSEALKDGLNSKELILIDGGAITITASDDGISCREGQITINGGTINILSMDEGIVAGYDPNDPDIVVAPTVEINPDITINNGEINITTYLERAHGIKSIGLITFNGGNTTITTEGLKSDGIDCDGGTVTLNGGTLSINASDDCMNTDPVINNGEYSCPIDI